MHDYYNKIFVFDNGKIVKLKKEENKILDTLLMNKGKFVKNEKLNKNIQRLHKYIREIRRKTKLEIYSVNGKGYVLI